MLKVSFVAVHLIQPMLLADHKSSTNGWCKCRVRILESSKPDYMGRQLIWVGRLPSCAPYFKFTCNCCTINPNGTISPINKDAEITYTLLNPERLTNTDKTFMVQEAALVNRKIRVELLSRHIARATYARDIADDPDFFHACDYFRLPYERFIKQYFKRQHAAIRKMSTDSLKKCKEMLQAVPWLMMFRRWSKKLFGLKELNFHDFMRLVNKDNLDPMVITACRLYWFIRNIHKKKGHTVFNKKKVGQAYLENYLHEQHLLDRAFDFLNFKAIKFINDDDFALWRDSEVVEKLLDNLNGLQEGFCETTDRKEINCKPLTDEQTDAVEHVTYNWLTCILGSPGHGKSEAIVHLVKTYKNILVVTFVGMAVDMLKARVSDYEHVYTIHYVFYRVLYSNDGPDWIKQFDMVVIDEGSNIDIYLFGKFISAVASAIKRLVIVGDLAQINPIKPGNPFRDLVTAYPEHVFTFTINLRVDPASRALADAAIHVKNNELDRIDFETSCFTIRDRTSEVDFAAKFAPTFAYEILNFQVLVLQNKQRKAINKAFVEQLELLGVLVKPQRAPSLRKDTYIYPGVKITFTKNYKEGKYPAVRNGELAIVEKMTQRGAYFTMKLQPSGKVVGIGDGDDLISLDDIDLGYAVTCNKAQGSEWNDVVFYIHDNLQSQWTREYAYVALSRAKSNCTIIGTLDELKVMCKNETHKRDTLLNYRIETTKLAGVIDDTMVEF